jgi:hypothetical protein
LRKAQDALASRVDKEVEAGNSMLADVKRQLDALQSASPTFDVSGSPHDGRVLVDIDAHAHEQPIATDDISATLRLVPHVDQQPQNQSEVLEALRGLQSCSPCLHDGEHLWPMLGINESLPIAQHGHLFLPASLTTPDPFAIQPYQPYCPATCSPDVVNAQMALFAVACKVAAPSVVKAAVTTGRISAAVTSAVANTSLGVCKKVLNVCGRLVGYQSGTDNDGTDDGGTDAGCTDDGGD